ncbi:hypothetical protein, partial [Pseudomonas sp. AU11447]|uniref:hypothetical protein n=1 Tax=Pseudomonas sp. AU11447 TaxID=1843184 RepID=UPI001C4821FC
MKRLILAASLLSLAIPAFAQISDKQAEDAYLYGYSIDKSKLYSAGTQTTRCCPWTFLRLRGASN